MRALILDRCGQPSDLRFGDVPVPEPGPGRVRVSVEACGLNPADAKLVRNGNAAWEWPHIMGLDVVGRVDRVGAGVGSVRPGQRIAYHGDLRHHGGLAEYAVTDAATLAVVPEGISAVDAAALPCAGMTAYQAVVRRLDVGADDTVLVTGAAGAVGGFAVQLAALAGARVIATTSAPNASEVRDLGASEVIDHRSENVMDRVRQLTGGDGVDAVVDTLGPESAAENLRLLSFGGGLAAVAGRPDLTAIPPFTTAPSLHEIALGAAHAHGGVRARRELSTMLAELLDLVGAGRLSTRVRRTLELGEVPAALEQLLGGTVRGKLVCSLSASG